jgi:hypothetical protein
MENSEWVDIPQHKILSALDHITARLLKDAATVIAPSLTQIFNLSLSSSTFPQIWKNR